MKYLAVLSIILMASCAQSPRAHIDAENLHAYDASLYERIGGVPILTVVVSDLIDNASSHPKLEHAFKGLRLSTLKESVVNQLCVLSGGDCFYEGESMRNAHYELMVTTAQFEIFVQILRDALNEHVGEREKNELLKILAPLKREIVRN